MIRPKISSQLINEKLTVKWYYINSNESNNVLQTEMLLLFSWTQSHVKTLQPN